MKVLVVEDNPKSATMLVDFLQKQDNIEIAGICENGNSCLEFLAGNEVDVVLLDIIMADLDGLAVLEKSIYQNLGKRPNFIMLSALRTENMITKACELGAKYYIVKPFDLNLLYKRIVEVVQGADQSNQKKELEFSGTNQYTAVDEKITSVFLMIGIPAHIKGYHFLRHAIKLVLEDGTLINKITKELYPKIAENFDTTPSKVERAIRHSIEVAWNRGKIENLNHVFGYQIYSKNDKPTNGEFIALMADRLTVGKFA